MEKKKLIPPLISLILTGTILLGYLFVTAAISFGWFMEKNDAEAAGMSVSASGGYNTEQYFILDGNRLSEEGVNIFSELKPADIAEITLCIKNNDTKDLKVLLYVSSPSEETDSVYTKDGLYHYFGTQIRFKSIKSGDTEHLALSGKDAYLLPLDASLYTNSLPPTALTAPIDFKAYTAMQQITQSITIPKGEEVLFDFEFEFVDNNTVQNAYIGFGSSESDEKSSLVLTREILCSFSVN